MDAKTNKSITPKAKTTCLANPGLNSELIKL